MLILVVLLGLIVLCIFLYYLFMSSSSQIFGAYTWHKDTSDKIVALTFDDGPNEPYTSQIADILAENDIKATFFQVGACVEKYPDVTKRLFTEGHVIGNHSVHHRFRDHILHPNYVHELEDNQKIISNVIGTIPALFRSPWLFRQPLLLNTVRKNGLYPISGTFCHPFEVFQPSGNRIAKRTITKVKPGSIIIFHDGFDARGGNRSQTVEALKITINSLKNLGYRFVLISELLSEPPYQNK